MHYEPKVRPSMFLPRIKYVDAIDKLGKKDTDTFDIIHKNQAFLYFGANHSRVLSDPQYEALQNYWNKFLTITKNQKRIVLVEGSLRKPDKDLEKAVIDGCEGNYISILANKDNVEIACPDVSKNDILKHLSSYDKDKVLLLWFLSWLGGCQAKPNWQSNLPESIQRWCDQQNNSDFWQGKIVNIPMIADLYKHIVGKNFDPYDNPEDYVDPNKTNCFTNVISRAQSDYRNIEIVANIERLWRENYSIFIVFGLGHLIIQKPALEEVLVNE